MNPAQEMNLAVQETLLARITDLEQRLRDTQELWRLAFLRAKQAEERAEQLEEMLRRNVYPELKRRGAE